MSDFYLNLFTYTAYIQIMISSFLGCFMVIQAVHSSKKKIYYSLFAITWFYLAAIEGFTSQQTFSDPKTYEFLRLGWGGLYLFSLLGLYSVKNNHKLIASAVFLLPIYPLWQYNWEMVTSFMFPYVFGFGAVLHGLEYKKNHGYSSVMLCASSFVLAVMCGSFYSVKSHSILAQEMTPLILGYLHYGVMVFIAIVGWTHFPREIEKGSFVKVKFKHVAILICIVVICEVLNFVDLINGGDTKVYIATMAIQALSFTVLHWQNKHNLVMYTANVVEAYAKTSEALKKIEELSLESDVKQEIIERQKRLEDAGLTAGSVAHDTQNQIMGIINIANNILTNSENYDKVKSNVMDIRNRVEMLQETNTQVLALSRRGRVEKLPVQLKGVFESVCSNQKLIGLNFEYDIDSSFYLTGSKSQLNRIFSNLIFNSMESYEDGVGLVKIAAMVHVAEKEEACYLGILEPGSYLKVSITDYGCGIPEDFKEKIFMQFESTKANISSGSGLGLFSVNRLVLDMEGIIDLVSDDSGTTFSIYFPDYRGNTEGLAVKNDVLNSNSGETVVVIDDDVHHRDRMSKLLVDQGYEVILFSSGGDALRGLHMERPDLILIDFDMPGMDGNETCFALANVVPGIKSAILSSFVSPENTINLKSMGVMEIIDKDLPDIDILKKVRYLLDERVTSFN